MDAFVKALVDAGISMLLDIRHMPVSRYRPEFSKRNLAERLNAAGIIYDHDRRLGIPSPVRREHGHPDHRESLWTWYDKNVIAEQIADLQWLDEIEARPMALMCVESNPEECHRHRLSAALETKGLTYAGDL